MIQAVFFDIDGTLVSFDTHKIPHDTREALLCARAKGVKLFVATGRHLNEAAQVLEDLPFDGYVTLNGQYCVAGGKVVYGNTISREDLERLVERLDQPDPWPCMFVEEKRSFINLIDDAVVRAHEAVGLPLPVVGDWHGEPGRAVYQLLAYVGPERDREVLALLPHCVGARWSPNFTDILPAGGGKSVGIEKMLAHFGIPREAVMALGDGENDIDMLQYVEVGVAMGNAAEPVKRAADEVTGPVDGGGVYDALARHGVI